LTGTLPPNEKGGLSTGIRERDGAMTLSSTSTQALARLAGRLTIWRPTSPRQHPHDLAASKEAVQGIDPSDRDKVIDCLVTHGLSRAHAIEVANLIV
jgi:hypothetical protein